MADELCREAEAAGGRAVAIPADISKKDAVKAMFAQVEEEFGRLDVLVLNAARAPFKPWEKLLERDLKLLVETNFLGNVFCLQGALPLLSHRGGAVVFISSLGSRYYHPEYPLGPMKAAMEAAVRHWAESFEERGVSVNAVCAGLVKTDSFKTLRLGSAGTGRVGRALFRIARGGGRIGLFSRGRRRGFHPRADPCGRQGTQQPLEPPPGVMERGRFLGEG